MKSPRRLSVRATSVTSQRRLKSESQPVLNKFFKIILLSTIKENMMKIPARFVRLGPKLSNIVTIETPVGFKRSIRIKRMGEEVWFENGWSEFAEAHSLSEGYFLMFHYRGDSSFSVIICDVSASEIDYPLDKVYVTESDDEVKEDEEGFTEFESNDNDSSEGVIDLDQVLKNNRIINMKSQNVTKNDDVEEIEFMDEVEEDERV